MSTPKTEVFTVDLVLRMRAMTVLSKYMSFAVASVKT